MALLTQALDVANPGASQERHVIGLPGTGRQSDELGEGASLRLWRRHV